MIVKSRVDGSHVLEVFESFHSDRTLPKFMASRKEPGQSQSDQIGVSSQGSFISSSSDSDWASLDIPVPRILVENSGQSFDKQPRFSRRRLVDAFARLLGVGAERRNEAPHGKVSPIEILLSVRRSMHEAQDYVSRVKAYDSAIEQAIKGGQSARANRLVKARQVVQQESMLRVAGFTQYLSEAQAIEFASKCQKGLRLDWVENFGRPIPTAVLARKVEADALKVFDNYVVLHYDPKGKAFSLTPEQVAAKKDPILFGVIEDVRKLYFIGDWKDDECDLTMEEVGRVLGHPGGEIPADPTVDF